MIITIKMVHFNSIVIFDLETTGLPHLEHNKTKITEISMIACQTSHCQTSNLPRALNKLVLVINPTKIISPDASVLTGLENDMLEDMKPFNDEVVTIINNFLCRLLQPVCLIAHNGNRFDFPILKRQLMSCNLKLCDGIYCADSLLAFKSIFGKYKESKTKIKRNVSNKFLALSNETRESEVVPISVRDLNETTPGKKTISYNHVPMKKSKKIQSNLKTLNVCKTLNFDDDLDEHVLCEIITQLEECDGDEFQQLSDCPKSYKLKDLYCFLHKKEFADLHRSENDCLALLSCIIKCKEAFLNWLSENACLLDEIQPLF